MFNARILCTLPCLRGLVTIGNVTYGIEPMDSSSGSEHIVYSLDNVKKEPSMCGVMTEGHEEGEHTGENHHPSMTQLLRVSAPLFSPVPYNGFHECSAKNMAGAYRISLGLNTCLKVSDPLGFLRCWKTLLPQQRGCSFCFCTQQ